MKLKLENLKKEWQEKLAPFDTPEMRELYKNRDSRIPRIELVKDINKRYRHDLLRVAIPSHTISDEVYEKRGANDEHLDSLLKAIVKPL